MMSEKKELQNEMLILMMEDLVPKDHLLRKIDRAIDFSFINDEVRHLYSTTTGRNSIEPVVLFKMVFLQYLYGIKSMRQTAKMCETDAAFRWFLGIPFGQSTPHFSTFSKNYTRKFQHTNVFENIFSTILQLAFENKMIGGKEFFTDSTHVKANANKKKYKEVSIEVAKSRRLELEAEINNEREELGRKKHNYEDEVDTKTIKQSTTDPESGYYHRDNKEEGFMYLAHRTVDGKFNLILDNHITAGNVHDSKPYVERMDYINSKYGLVPKAVALDSGYNSIDIYEYLLDKDIYGVVGYKRNRRNKELLNVNKFKYDEERDIFVCPIGVVLPYKNISKDGYKEYYDGKNCKGCPIAEQCFSKSSKKRVIRVHVKNELNKKMRVNRISEYGRELYARRKMKVELSFADSKQNFGYRYATHRGRAKVQNYSWLLCAIQNLKKISTVLERRQSKHIELSQPKRKIVDIIKGLAELPVLFDLKQI